MKGIDIAAKMVGLHENKNTKELDAYILKRVPAWKGFCVNSTPWCAAIIGAWEKDIGNEGTGKLNARSYLTYGKTVYHRDKKIGKLSDVQKGDIAVFERGGSSWQGHVAYVVSIQNGLVKTIGGNQSDSVSVGWYPVSRLISVRRT